MEWAPSSANTVAQIDAISADLCDSLCARWELNHQGGLILGIGGDNSAGGVGTFYEGAVTKGFSTDAADDAVQTSIVAAGYVV